MDSLRISSGANVLLKGGDLAYFFNLKLKLLS